VDQTEEVDGKKQQEMINEIKQLLNIFDMKKQDIDKIHQRLYLSESGMTMIDYLKCKVETSGSMSVELKEKLLLYISMTTNYIDSASDQINGLINTLVSLYDPLKEGVEELKFVHKNYNGIIEERDRNNGELEKLRTKVKELEEENNQWRKYYEEQKS